MCSNLHAASSGHGRHRRRSSKSVTSLRARGHEQTSRAAADPESTEQVSGRTRQRCDQPESSSRPTQDERRADGPEARPAVARVVHCEHVRDPEGSDRDRYRCGCPPLASPGGTTENDGSEGDGQPDDLRGFVRAGTSAEAGRSPEPRYLHRQVRLLRSVPAWRKDARPISRGSRAAGQTAVADSRAAEKVLR